MKPFAHINLSSVALRRVILVSSLAGDGEECVTNMKVMPIPLVNERNKIQ